MNNNGIKIMILEGADILKDNLDNIYIKKEYKGIFADSSLLDKLKQIGLKENMKEESTTDIIMLNFTYGYNSKESKEVVKKINSLNDEKNNLIRQKKQNIEIRKQQKGNKDKKPYTDMINKLAKDIKNIKSDIKNMKELIDNNKNKKNKDTIREELYMNGFHLDFYKKDKDGNAYKDTTIEYCFWFRTPSKSRVGDAIFINKKLYYRINSWQTMGIVLQKDKNNKVKKVEMEAYKSLTASHIIKKIYIPTDGILVVNDLNSFITTMCNEVYYHISDDEVNINDTEDMCFVRNNLNKVSNTLWDGMMLLDKEYCKSGFMLLRNHFFKACAFSSNIKQFFINWCKENGYDYDTYKVPDRYGNMKKVKDIVAITTENSMKWEKLFNDKVKGYESWINHVKADNELFGVCKIDHKSKYGDYQRMSYQMINSLPIDRNSAIDLVKDTKKVVENMKDNNDLFIKHLKRTATIMNNNDMMIDLYEHNSDFAETELFRKYKTKALSEYKETLRAGKLLTNADNLTVCGNPYLLLLHSVGALNKYINGNVIEGYEDNTLPKLDNGYASCYTIRFGDEILTGFRNPHNSFANILKLQNYRTNDTMDKYFNFGDNVIALDMINSDLQERANSMDEDSDFIYTTNNRIINQAMADKNYPCIVNKISESKKTYEDNNKELARIDNGLAKSKYAIGLSSNLAQLALSWYWKNPTRELEDIVSICSVLAQCAIDNSKRLYEVNLNAEIARIRRLPCMQLKTEDGYVAKPYFWQFVKEIKEIERKYDKSEDKEIELINKSIAKAEAKKNKTDKENDIIKHCITEQICPMDWVQIGIDFIKNIDGRNPYLDILLLLKSVDGKAKQEQMDKIIALIKQLDDIYKKQNDDNNNNKMDDEAFTIYSQIKADEVISKIKSYSIKEKNMEMLIKNTLGINKTRMDSIENNSKYRLRLLNCLYKAHKDTFLSVWKKK